MDHLSLSTLSSDAAHAAEVHHAQVSEVPCLLLPFQSRAIVFTVHPLWKRDLPATDCYGINLASWFPTTCQSNTCILSGQIFLWRHRETYLKSFQSIWCSDRWPPLEWEDSISPWEVCNNANLLQFSPSLHCKVSLEKTLSSHKVFSYIGSEIRKTAPNWPFVSHLAKKLLALSFTNQETKNCSILLGISHTSMSRKIYSP